MEAKIGSYKRTLLYQTEYFEIVSCEWGLNSISQMHEHGASDCFVLVEEGTFEDQIDFGVKKEYSVKETGQAIVTPAGARHELRCISNYGKTLHIYTPPVNLNSLKFKSDSDEINKLELNLETNGKSWSELMSIFKSISQKCISTQSPYFLNQLFSGTHSQMLYAEKFIAQHKTTLATHEASPVFSQMEIEVVERLCEQVGWEKAQSGGVSVPGGSSGNFMAIHCARQRKIPEFKKSGLQTGNKFKIFVSADAHYSFKKACIVLGFGLDALVIVDVDKNGEMKPGDFEAKINFQTQSGNIPFIVCATLGSTVSGALDPISEISKISQKYDLWLHADAAWGAPAIFSKRYSEKLKDIHKIDSLAFDAHKFFGAGLTCSFFLTKHPNILLEANDVSGGDYLFHSEEKIDRGRMSWQCGRRADAVSFWTLWKSVGTAGLELMIENALRLKDEFVSSVKQQQRLRLIGDPGFLNVCVQVLPPSQEMDSRTWSLLVRQKLMEKNLAMVNYSVDSEGVYFLRFIIAHPQLNIADLNDILTSVLEIQ